MSYMEEVFQRAENKFSSVQQQLGWLSSFDARKGNAYEKDAVKVAEELSSFIDLKDKIKRAKPSELPSLQNEANSLGIKKLKNEVTDLIKDRGSKLSQESTKVSSIAQNRMKAATNQVEIDNILDETEPDLSEKEYNRLKSNANILKKELRQKAHEELLQRQAEEKAAREEREAREEKEKEEAEYQAEKERVAEANRIRIEGERRKHERDLEDILNE